METLADAGALTNRLVDVVPLSDSITGIAQADDGAWILEFSDKTMVVVEWASAPGRIVLNAPLGTPSKERAEELFSLALSYSALSRESCGARLGLGGADGELLLIREIYNDTASGRDLLPVLEHFAYVASWWQGVIAQPARPAANAREDHPSELLVRA
jgi:hypothetical protein